MSTSIRLSKEQEQRIKTWLKAHPHHSKSMMIKLAIDEFILKADKAIIGHAGGSTRLWLSSEKKIKKISDHDRFYANGLLFMSDYREFVPHANDHVYSIDVNDDQIMHGYDDLNIEASKISRIIKKELKTYKNYNEEDAEDLIDEVESIIFAKENTCEYLTPSSRLAKLFEPEFPENEIMGIGALIAKKMGFVGKYERDCPEGDYLIVKDVRLKYLGKYSEIDSKKVHE